MGPIGQFLIGLVMAVGLVGTLIPILPGLTVIWLAGLAWVFLDGPDATHWIIFAIMTAFYLLGQVLAFYLPAKSAVTENPKWTLAMGAVFAIAGFFLIPVVGAPLGFVFGIFLRILLDSREFHRAIRATGKTLKSLGLATAVQCGFGIAICTTWALGLILIN